MRVALAQIDCDLGDITANLRRAEAVIAEARSLGADLVVFPELNLTGYSLGAVSEDLSMRADDHRLASLATEMDVIVGFVERAGLHAYNSAAHLSGGQLRFVQRKLYLPTYGIYEERKHVSPGQSLDAFSLAEAHQERAAVLICNDAWQPALAFLAVQEGASVLFLPSASAVSPECDGLDLPSYWRDITRFYARMFETHVVFVNRVGKEGELTFWGGSHAVSCTGELVAEAPGHTEALVVADLDLAAVARRRHQVPLVREARLGLLSRQIARLLDHGGDA